MALVLVDKDNYILDGVLYEIPLLDVPLDELSVEKAVTTYKQKLVDRGAAFGGLDVVMEQSRENDMPLEEYEHFAVQNPIDVAQSLQWDDGGDNEEVLHPMHAAFQVMDIMFDPESRNIMGRIHILNTPDGQAARRSIDANMRCMVTQAMVDEIVDRNRRITHGFVLNQIIRKIRGGWRISFEKEETVEKQTA